MKVPAKLTTAALSLAFALAAPLAAADRAAQLDNLYQSNQWFEFRDAMSQGPAPAFYRGELALAFHDWPQAEREFLAVMKAGADPVQAFEAGLGLERIYELSGRRKDARALLSKMDQLMRSFRSQEAIAPVAYRNFESYRAALAAASGYPDQSVVARGRSRVLYSEVDNQLIVPLLVNGAPANYLIDTGAEECVVSAAEAKRLGLTVQPTSGQISGFGPHIQPATGVAVANDVVIGNFHLRNVIFLVTPGDDASGTIGLPVLLAFETLRWSSDGTMDFGFPAQPRNVHESNLCIAESLLYTLAEIGKQNAVLGLDTGSYESLLFPRFKRDFPDLLKEPVPLGERDAPDGTVPLAALALRLGGLRTLLSPALALPTEPVEDASWVHGWLGMDLLGQARSVTLDLAAMKLTLDGADAAGPTSAGAACPLPSGFVCAPGFKCTVKAAGSEPCFVDRSPVDAWPGNVVNFERGAGAACVLSAGAHCEKDSVCRAVFDSNQSCRVIEESGVLPAREARPASGTAAISAIPAASLPGSVDARDVVQRSLKYESLDLAPARDYVYQEEEEEKMLNADGSVKSTTLETREVLNLYGETYKRLIRKDGKDLPPDKARAAQARFDKAVEKRAHETSEAKAKREEAKRKRAAEDLVCEEEFVKMFDYRMTGSEAVNGRMAWIVELNPLPNTAPRCGDLKTLTKFHFKLWIDQAEYRWARFEGDNIAPVTWGKILARVPTEGLHVVVEQTRHEDGVWLESREQDKVNVKVLLAVTFRIDDLTTYSNYRKFQADSRIVPVDEGK